MKSFKQFVTQEYALLDQIRQYDRSLFKNICQGKYDMSPQQIQKFELSKKIITQSGQEKNYLQNDQQIKLIKLYQDNTNKNGKQAAKAMEALVDNKTPYIHKMVNKYVLTHPRHDNDADKKDLFQQGVLGLMKAVETFDLESGNIFNAYAKTYINGAIINYFNAIRKKSLDNGKLDYRTGEFSSVGSLDEIVSGDKGEWADKDTSVADSVPDQNAIIPGEEQERYEDDNKLAFVRSIINQLPEQQKIAMNMYFPQMGEKATFEEIGEYLKTKFGKDGVGTAMGVKKMIDRTIKQLKQASKQEFGN